MSFIKTLQFAPLLVTLALSSACGGGETKLLDAETGAEFTLQVSSDLTLDASPSPFRRLSFAVSATETVDLHEVVLVFNHVGFTSSPGEHAGMSPKYRPTSTGHDATPTQPDDMDSHENMMALEEAGPFVVDLGLGLTKLGTFEVPKGTYSMVELKLAPLPDTNAQTEHANITGLSVFLEGTYSNDVTTVPFEAKLALSSEETLMLQTMAELDGHVLGAIRVQTKGWFDGLALKSAMVSGAAGPHVEITGSGELAKALFERVSTSFSFGLDVDGDGTVSDAEFLTSMGNQ